MSEPAVALRGITKRFGKVVAVDRVDLEVDEGEFFSMLGPSGSGKTTCLRMIAGFDQPTEGRVELAGEDVTRKAPFERDVNTVFQDYALFPHMTVIDNVSYGLRVRRVARAERLARAEAALAMVRLAGFEDRKPAQLSGGQRQRVALARALVNRPRVLLLDEPLGALDLKLRHQMQVELKAIQREVGITFVFVTHDQEEALTMSDRLAVFSDGRVEQIGAPRDVYEHPESAFVADFVGVSNLVQPQLAHELVGVAAPFSVRPERIRLHGADEAVSEGQLSVAATVVDVVFLGTFTRYRAETADGTQVSAVVQNADGSEGPSFAKPGKRVVLSWAPEAMRRLAPADSDCPEEDVEG